MKRNRPAEHTPRVIVVTVVSFAGLFAAIPGDEVWLLACFALVFAILACVVDPQVRALWSFPRSRQPRRGAQATLSGFPPSREKQP